MSEAMKADLIEVIAMEMSKIDVIWLDQLTPNIAFAIWQAALSQQPAQPDTSLLGSLDKNWQEDSSHENGNYCCKCSECNCMFLGHKRRVICKECSNKPAQPTVKESLTVQAQPTEHVMGLLGAACYLIRKYEPESNLLQKIRDVTFDRKPVLPSCADLKIKSQVIRYSLDEGGKGINFDEFGNYVHICDYEGLLAENERLKEELRPILVDSVARAISVATEEMWMRSLGPIVHDRSKITASHNKAKKQRRKSK
jgi:hypothetical protein